jgi:hypothetical protein
LSPRPSQVGGPALLRQSREVFQELDAYTMRTLSPFTKRSPRDRKLTLSHKGAHGASPTGGRTAAAF